MSGSENTRITDELMAVLGTGGQTRRHEGLGMADAYAIAAEIRVRRTGRGERGVGRKIGFTNTRIWPLYGVSAPMWNFMYDTTVHDDGALAGEFGLRGLPKPRVEPEIVFGLGAAPVAGMTDAEILGCVDWVAHGFEIVQSVYPGWKLTCAESAAAFGLHGALILGSRHPLERDRAAWDEQLPALGVTLTRGGDVVTKGVGANVLGGPVQALRFLVEEIARYPVSTPLAAGEIITTGTLTDAQPVAPGDVWSTELRGVPLEGLRVAFA